MRILRHAPFIAVLLALMALTVPAVAHADVNDFDVTSFSADYYLSASDPQGALAISEHLSVNFTDQNHGILRALPQKYNGQDEHLHITAVKRDGMAEPYTSYSSNGNEVLKIGRASSTISGAHTYDISYSVQNVIRFDTAANALTWNTNGTEWSQPFQAITARLHVPKSLASAMQNVHCYTGAQGSSGQDCIASTVALNGDDVETTYTTTRPLNAGENLTLEALFAPGTFVQPTAKDWWREHAAALLQIVVPALVAFGVAFAYWHKNGKDLKGRGTIIPEYAPPDGLRAAEADVINHYKLSKNGISATVIDLAIRKYLKIIEGESAGILGLGKHKTYSFQKLPTPPGDTLKPYETTILSGIFYAGDTATTDDLKDHFYKQASLVESSIPASLTDGGYFPANPTSVIVKFAAVCVVVVIAGAVLSQLDAPLGIGLIVGGVLALPFSLLMPRRTQLAVDAKDTLAGLKLYMEVAEKDRIAMLQSPNAPYAAASAEPTKTVELFEKLLPYAMVLGVEQGWAKQFEGIYTSPPDWYGGNWTAFNTGLLVGSLADSMSAMNTSFAAPSSAGSGSGGSFSGGGGGGGGGGGW